jgi:hypothetical protein
MWIHSIWQSHWQVLTLVDAFTIRIFLITFTGMATIRQAIARRPVYKPNIRSIWDSLVRSLACACNRVTVVLVVPDSQYTFNRTSRVWLLWLIITHCSHFFYRFFFLLCFIFFANLLTCPCQWLTAFSSTSSFIFVFS